MAGRDARGGNMMKFYAGLIAGFFLAFALVFGFVQVELAPHYNEIKQIQPDVQAAYDATHSADYASVQEFMGKVKEAGDKLSALPVIGSGFSALKIQDYAQRAISLMGNAKGISEGLVPLVGTAIAAIEAAAWAFWLSVVLMLAGFYLLFRVNNEEKEAAKAARAAARAAKKG